MPIHLPNNKSWDAFWVNDYQKVEHKISWAKKRIEGVAKLFSATSGVVLDAGCGSGYFSRMFLDQGRDVIALDYSIEALHATRRITEDRVQIVQADLVHEQLSQCLSSAKISSIFSDGLLEHFVAQDQDCILRNFHSVLAEDGVVITFVPNRWSPWQIIRPFFMPGIVERPFVLSSLKDLHQRNGFRVVSAGGINVLPFCFSPEFLGRWFGMLLYVVAKKQG